MNKFLLHSTWNGIQYSVTYHLRKEYEKDTYCHSAVEEITQHFKSLYFNKLFFKSFMEFRDVAVFIDRAHMFGHYEDTLQEFFLIPLINPGN